MGMHDYKVLFCLSPFKSEILAFNPQLQDLLDGYVHPLPLSFVLSLCLSFVRPTYLVGLEMCQVEKTAYRAMNLEAVSLSQPCR